MYSFSGGSEIVLLPFYHKYTLLSIALAVNCFIVVGVEEKAGTPVLPVKVYELLVGGMSPAEILRRYYSDKTGISAADSME